MVKIRKETKKGYILQRQKNSKSYRQYTVCPNQSNSRPAWSVILEIKPKCDQEMKKDLIKEVLAGYAFRSERETSCGLVRKD